MSNGGPTGTTCTAIDYGIRYAYPLPLHSAISYQRVGNELVLVSEGMLNNRGGPAVVVGEGVVRMW